MIGRLLLRLQALPESLRYLLAAGQNDKAADVVRRMAASHGKQLPRGQLTASAEVVRLMLCFLLLKSSVFCSCGQLDLEK